MKSRVYFIAATLLASATATNVLADYSNTVMGLNPIAYYQLNETEPVSADTAINRGTAGAIGTGLYLNNPPHEQPGALAGSANKAIAVNLSGENNQRMGVPYDPSVNPTGSFTAEVWVNPSSAQTGGNLVCPISFWVDTGKRYGWLIYQGASGWNLRMYNGVNTSQVVDITGGGAPVVGQWYHLVVVYDGANANLYVNGQAAGVPKSAAAYVPNIGGPLSVGARADGNFWFPGYADEVAIYTNALSAAEILAHYQNGINPTPAQSYDSLVLALNPLLYHRLDEPTFSPGGIVTAVNRGSLGMGANGTYEAGAFTGLAGPPYAGFGGGNKALTISTLAGDVLIPSGQPINTNHFTITCWFKRTGVHVAGQALVFNRYGNNQATGLGFGYNGSPGVDQLNVHWNEGPSSWLTGLTPPNDVWCFGAAVYTPTNVTVYLNDTSSSLNTTLGAHDFGPAPIYIGWDPAFTRFQGSIDEVALFDRALTPSQVQSLLAASQMTPQFMGFTRTPSDPLFEGYNVTMTATVAGVPPLSYQWYKGTTALPGKTEATLSITGATLGDSGEYRLVATNPYGATTSAVQTILISTGPPSFLSQNIFNATRAVGGRVTYSVVAGGSAPMSFQWKKDGAPIPGATEPVLNLRNLQLTDAGNYSVSLLNAYGSADSTNSGILTVTSLTNYPFAAMYGNPLAYYRLNETAGTTAADIAGGLTGTLVGSITKGITGPRPPGWLGLESGNTAYQFDGAATRLQLPAFNMPTNQVTIVAWINPAGPQSDQTGILVSRSSRGLSGLFIDRSGTGALGYVWSGNDSWWQFASGLVPVVGQWNFVALVVEPDKGTLYLDDGSGLRSAVYVAKHETQPFDSPNIGVDLGYTRWFNGGIDEVVVYDRALSPSEVANLGLLGAAGPVAPRVLQQPVSVMTVEGGSGSMSAVAGGWLPLSYQWRRDGAIVPGATSATLTIPSVYFADAGSYVLWITNSIGYASTTPATLEVLPQPTFANLTNDLVLHLRFDGDYNDASGRGNHAFSVGAPTFVGGAVGQGVHINSTPGNNYVTVIDTSGTDLVFEETTSFSVAFWVKYTAGFNDLPIIGNAVGSTWQPGWVFTDSATAGQIELSLVSTANTGTYLRDPVPGCPTINDNQWHHVLGVIDREAQVASVYVDGAFAGSWSIAGLGTLFNGSAVTIGQDPTGAYNDTGTFDLDDVGIWRRALNSFEAAGIYAAAQAGNSFDVYGPVKVDVRHVGNNIDVIWQAGTLLESSTVNGQYLPVSGASAPYYRATATGQARFFRVQL